MMPLSFGRYLQEQKLKKAALEKEIELLRNDLEQDIHTTMGKDESGSSREDREAKLKELESQLVAVEKEIEKTLMGSKAEVFHLVYKIPDKDSNPYILCLCNDVNFKETNHLQIYNWSPRERLTWYSFSANRSDTKFDSLEMLLDHFTVDGQEEPAPIGAPVPRPAEYLFDYWFYVWLFLWIAFLLVGILMQLYTYASPEWVIMQRDANLDDWFDLGKYDDDNDMPDLGPNDTLESGNIAFPVNKIGIINTDKGSIEWDDVHWAWQASIVLFIIEVIFQILALVFAVLLWFKDTEKIIGYGRIFNVLGNLVLFTTIAIWPMGLDSPKLAPCTGEMEPQSYYVCRPWELGWATVLQIITTLIFTGSQMIGSLVRTKSQRVIEEDNMYQDRYLRARESMWYDLEHTKLDGSTEDPTKARSDGTIGPLQTSSKTRETSFWSDEVNGHDGEGQGRPASVLSGVSETMYGFGSDPDAEEVDYSGEQGDQSAGWS